MHVHCEMIPTIELTLPSSHIFTIYLFVLVQTLKFYSLSKFQLYSAALSTIVTMLYIRSSDLIHRITESVHPFTNLSPFVATPSP